MRPLITATGRLRRARGLPAVLDAACDAFEAILAVIGHYETTASTGLAVTFLLAGTQAANGRDAVLFAPALPPRALHPPAPAAEEQQPAAAQIQAAAAALAALLAGRLARTAAAPCGPADRAACHDAARYAARVCDLLTGLTP